MNSLDGSQIVANSLPFIMAYVIEWQAFTIPVLAGNMLEVLTGKSVVVSEALRDLAIRLAVHLYSQLSFILSVVLSTVAGLALSLSSPRPLVGILVAFCLIVLLVMWLFRWQTLGAKDDSERESRDREMRRAAVVNTSLIFAATLWARWP